MPNIKLTKNKNIIAFFTTVSLLSFPTISLGEAHKNKVDAYYEENNFNINDYESYKLTISKNELAKLINSSNENVITLKIGNKKIIITKNELLQLKEKADKYEKENREYVILINVVGGTIATSIIVKELYKKR